MVRSTVNTVSALSILAAALVASPAAAQDMTERSAMHDYRVVTVVEGLVNPWAMAFLPGGDMLVTERAGHLRVVQDGSLLPDPVSGLPTIHAQGQGGLLDIALDPDFASNSLIYLSYSKPNDEGSTTAVVRGHYADGVLSDVEEVFEAVSQGRNGHYGSRLAFDADGLLYITVGDRQIASTGDLEAHPAQDITNNHGTVNRIHPDGSIPEDNPFVGQDGAHPAIYSYGHRNQQGLIVHPETGDVWAVEHGPQGGDELNLIQPGNNYGWPVVGYGVNYRSGSAIHEGTRRDGMESPTHFWVPSIATSGLMVYTGDQFPEWRGNLFVGGLSGQQIARLTLDGQSVTREETLFQGHGRIRDVRQGPDGFIYVAIDHRNGEPTSIVRFEPVTRH